MHYFIEHTDLTQQNSIDTFGVDSLNPQTKFNITSGFQLNNPAKAFACQDGMIIIQQSDIDETLVNVIIKPIEGLKINFAKIQYFVYRGILKNSLISGDTIVSQSSTNNEFITRIWEDHQSFKDKFDQPNLPIPTPSIIGYSNTLSSNLNVEKIYDNSQEGVRPLFIKQGEWFGDFSNSTKVGFEVITESDRIIVDLAYLRKEKHQIDISGLINLELRAKKEEILSFIDPASLFGLHYGSGIYISTYSNGHKTTIKKEKEEIYNLLIAKFSTKNRIYFDIRSEYGYSYNFYQNYSDNTGQNIKIGYGETTLTEKIYEENGWPILYIENAPNVNEDYSNIIFQLRIDDNIKPILYTDNTDLLINGLQSKFIDHNTLLDNSSNEWSKKVQIAVPNIVTNSIKNNVTHYIKFHYFRQEYNGTLPTTVLTKKRSLDTIFGSLNMPYLGDSNYTFQSSSSNHRSFVMGQLAFQNFSGVATSEAHFDINRVVISTRMLHPYEKTTLSPYPYTAIGDGYGIHLEGNFNQMSFLKRDLYNNVQIIQEKVSPTVYEAVNVLGVSHYNGTPNSRESLFLLGLMKDELVQLQSVTGLSTKHDRYIVFEDISPNPAEDKDGKPYQKFQLKIQGLNDNGLAVIVAPLIDIFVYTTKGFVFCSKAFADTELESVTTIYPRIYEESIGFKSIEPVTKKRYEDWFLDKDNGLKVEVDSFINTLSMINNDSNFYVNVKALVEDSATDIWNQAVTSVQANNNENPDDRPLYWARIKMEVALKSHPYFMGGVNNSDLNTLITIFEENSRNYMGVNFSNAPTGTKKILITGFDPFFLNDNHTDYGEWSNIKQSNPSGCVALALHDTLTQNGIGYIQTMIFPVRYADFDNSQNPKTGQGTGVVEKYINSWLDEVDMIITISQALPNEYHLDVFATATRGGLIDNMGFERVENSKSINGSSIETIVTTLPNEFAQNNSQAIFYGKYFQNQQDEKDYDDGDLNKQKDSSKSNYPTSKVFSAPGGNYLSNEIFYRVAKLREEWIQSKLPNVVTKATGHFHISELQTASKTMKEDFSITKTQNLLNIVKYAINEGVTGL